VVCFDPRHDQSLASLGKDGVRRVLEALQEEERRYLGRPDLAHVLMFENRGAAVGVSNPHPHGQIYAVNFVFKTIETEVRAAARHACGRHPSAPGGTLLGAVLCAEEADGRRILFSDPGAVAFVPHFARYAYEAFVMPRAPRLRLADLRDDEVRAMAGALHAVLLMYDRLWGCPFPYVMAFHDAPLHDPSPGFHWHIELHPPLRKPGLLKYLAGPEIGGGSFLADTSPEEKAAELRRGAGPLAD
jgi:UDPglucose--hexose-1-phosphate uridylyltransferase